MPTLPRDPDGNLIVRIGHSPDPDDAFMFHAMTTNAFNTRVQFCSRITRYRNLESSCNESRVEVSAVSIHAYPDILNIMH